MAALHLALLPHVLSEPDQVTASLLAGAGYLALAAADRLTHRTPA